MTNLNDIRDVFKRVKHRNITQIYCPRCCSPKIRLASSLAIWLTPKQYYCEECGYIGIIVLELEKEDEPEKEKEETDTQLKKVP